MRILMFIVLALTFVKAHASEAHGRVYDVYVHKSTKVFFRIEGAKTAECAGSGRYAISLTGEGGEALFATLLSARASKEPIYIKGSGVCNLHHDTEDINYIKY